MRLTLTDSAVMCQITSASMTPITSCSYETWNATTFASSNVLPASWGCACNDDGTIKAGGGFMTGSDGWTSTTCDVGTTTTIVVGSNSPAPVSTANGAPSATGTSPSATAARPSSVPTTTACTSCYDFMGDQTCLSSNSGQCLENWCADNEDCQACEVPCNEWPVLLLGSSSSAAPDGPTSASSAAPSSSTPSAPSYQTGTCNVHIVEAVVSKTEPFFAQLNVTDGEGTLLASQGKQLEWGDNYIVDADDSSLPWDVNVTFSTDIIFGWDDKPRNDVFQNYIIYVDAGESQTSSDIRDRKGDDEGERTELPWCEVGAWDNANSLGDFIDSVLGVGAFDKVPNRQMDCRFVC